MTTVEKTREFYETVYLQIYLEESSKRFILCEKIVWARNPMSSIIGVLGFPATVAINPDSWVMSFIIPLSLTKIEGINASSNSINTTQFVWFYWWCLIKPER